MEKLKGKILIFSDTHLTKRFEEKKYNLLVRLVSSSDRVIINGDFWDSWFVSFKDFLGSKWNKLFPLLRERERDDLCLWQP